MERIEEVKKRCKGRESRFGRRQEVVRIRTNALSGKMKGDNPSPDDLFGDECQKGGQTANDERREDKGFRNDCLMGVIKKSERRKR